MSTNIAGDIFANFYEKTGSGPSQGVDTDTKPAGFDKSTIDALKNITNQASGDKSIDTKSVIPKISPDKLPDYWSDYEEKLSAKFEFPEDTTDYSSLAIENFGQNFAHLNSRDAIYDHVMLVESTRNFLENSEQYAEIEKVLNTNLSDGDFLRDVIQSEMTRGRNALTVTTKSIQEKLDEFFDEGSLNAKGQQLVNEIKNGYKGEASKLKAQANQHAANQVKEFKAYKNDFESELSKFSLYGLELGDDLKKHIKEIVFRGEESTDSQKLTNKDRVRKEILNAIVTDEKAFLEIARMIDKRGIEYGVNQKAKSIFN